MEFTFKHNLELHINVLHTLACHAPLQISSLESKVKIACSALKKQLDFLVQNGLIEKRPKTKPLFFTPIQNGVKPFNWFSEPTDFLKLEPYTPT